MLPSHACSHAVNMTDTQWVHSFHVELIISDSLQGIAACELKFWQVSAGSESQQQLEQVWKRHLGYQHERSWDPVWLVPGLNPAHVGWEGFNRGCSVVSETKRNLNVSRRTDPGSDSAENSPVECCLHCMDPRPSHLSSAHQPHPLEPSPT